MAHGPHHDCLMCKMAKTVGMMEKHPRGCNCQSHPQKEDEQKRTNQAQSSGLV